MGVRRFTTKSNEEGGEPGESFWFWCDGCDINHRFVIKHPEGESGSTWGFDGNMEKPTFSPSLLCNGYLCLCKLESCKRDHPILENGGHHRCHLHLRNGMVQYLVDCSHKLAGKTVPVKNSSFE